MCVDLESSIFISIRSRVRALGLGVEFYGLGVYFELCSLDLGLVLRFWFLFASLFEILTVCSTRQLFLLIVYSMVAIGIFAFKLRTVIR